MQIQLKQNELEIAVRDYVNKMGITRPIGKIDFTATRGNGGGISTEIELSEPASTTALKPVTDASCAGEETVTVSETETAVDTDATEEDADVVVEGEEKKSLFQ